MIESQRSGAGSDEIFKPRLWYYEHLLFLQDQELPRKGISNMNMNEDSMEDVSIFLLNKSEVC